MADQIRYDLLTQQALRGVVRSVLSEAAKKGLPGDHHFYISFDTHADGVRMSERLRAQHPEEMTIILQHQFWDLTVNEQGFEVGLSFGGITERLVIPFEAIKGFFDPSVQFGLQFEEVTEGQDHGQQTPANAQGKAQDREQDKPGKKKRLPPTLVTPETLPAPAPAAVAEPEPGPDKPTSSGGEVVRLDRFRKK
ncbi:MAG TPA: ClpXP protease specificity-enhancing factor SspB [Pseudolabrys sp.]|jgi:hypothetical protein